MRSYRILSAATAAAVLLAFSGCGQVTGTGETGEQSAASPQSATAAAVTGEATESQPADPAVTTAAESTQPTVTTTLIHTAEDVDSISLSFTETTLTIGESTMPMVTMLPDSAPDKSEIWTSSDPAVATVDSMGNITGVGEGNCTVTVTSASTPDVKADVAVTVEAAAGMTYIDGILIVNKTYSLPQSYNPGGLTPETEAAFNELVQGAAADGLNIYLSSGFRSYEYQDEIYNNYISVYGKAATDTFSARPGHSEHQTGMAIDVNIIDDSFTGTPEAIWIENHCNEYGFVLRYPQGKQSVTGYKYEPWHIRYVGKDFAQKLKEAAAAAGDPYLTIEEYLNIDSEYKN